MTPTLKQRVLAKAECKLKFATTKESRCFNDGERSENLRLLPLITALADFVGEIKNSVVIEDDCEECGTKSVVRYEIREVSKAFTALERLLEERDK